MDRTIQQATRLRNQPSIDAERILDLVPGEGFAMLDDNLGWAWGYAGKERRVGYVPLEALARL